MALQPHFESEPTLPHYTHDGRLPSPLPWNSGWDVEAAQILRTSLSIQDIKLIFRFRLYQDETLPRFALQTRWEAMLNNFLDWLHIERDELDKYQKVEAILRQLAPPPPRKVCWNWTPSDAMYETDTERIAAEIDEQSHSQFKEFPFEDWVRRSLGFYVPSVAEFCNQHSELRGQLNAHLNNHPEAYLKYVCVAKALSSRSPFAYRAVCESLLDRTFSAPDRSFEYLLGPLEELFRHRPLTETLKRLAVLAVRFERCYMGEAEMDWKSRFRTDTTFFESLTCISSQSLANPITVSDKQAFSRLGLHDFVDYYQNRTVPNHLNQLNVQWNELCEAGKECVVADRQIGFLLYEVARHLYRLLNYYSSTAMLQALRNARFDAFAPSSLYSLVDTAENYAIYREAWARVQGLPFLFPHTRMVLSSPSQEQMVSEIFALLSEILTFLAVESKGRSVGLATVPTPEWHSESLMSKWLVGPVKQIILSCLRRD